MASPGEALLEKINNTDKQILLNGLPHETFINDIKDVVKSFTPPTTYKDTFEQFIKLLNGKDEADEEIFTIDQADQNWVNIKDEGTFRTYYTPNSHTSIKKYFTIKTMKIFFKDIFSAKDEIQKFNKAKEEGKEENLLNSVLPQPDFTMNGDDDKIKEGIKKILQDPKAPEIIETLKDKVTKTLKDDKENKKILNDYTLLNDNKTNFNNTPLISDFVKKCIKDADSKECLPHVGKMFNTKYDILIEYFESQIKQLPRDKLLKIAKGLDIRIYPPTGLFENEKLWERHTNFLDVDFTGQKTKVEGILAHEFLTYKDTHALGTDDNVIKTDIKNKLTTGTTQEKKDYNDIIVEKQKRITTIKGYLLEFVKVLSHELNEKKYETDEKDEKDRPNSRFNKDVVQYRILNNSRLYPNNPFYWINPFFGGKFELKPNKNQTADILEKMIKALLESLSAHNKYLNQDDIQLIYTAIDKLRKLETYLGELFVEASNYAETIQKENNMTQQYITINKFKENNKKISETTSKITTLKQKIEYLVNTLYTQKKEEEEENKTKQLENKEKENKTKNIGITVNV